MAKAQANVYSGVLLDLILPDVGGWEVLHSIRAEGPNQQVPVIVVTVVAEMGVAKGFPVQDFLVKPVEPQTLLESLKKAGISPMGNKKKILVVDDDPNTLKMAKATLDSSGYDAVCHSSGMDGLAAAAKSEFCAVVLDLLMPEIDGFEFLDRLRVIPNYRNTPVIVWTNKDVTARDRERLKHAAQAIALKGSDGVNDVLRELERYVGHPADSPPLPPPAQSMEL
jgi:CheY-like chemotaxis protein